VLARQGRLAEARERFAAAVALDPGHGPARLNLGKALLAEGALEDALPHLEQAVRLRPGDAVARELLAKVLFSLGRPEEALPHYAELAHLRPSPASHNNLGSALARSGRLAEAVAAYREALRLDPGFAEAHANLATTYLHLRDPAAAAVHADAARRLRR
jgi:Flp pilus assembly protein TadD